MGGAAALSLAAAELFRKAAQQADGIEVVEANEEELKGRLQDRRNPPPPLPYVAPITFPPQKKARKPKGPRYSSYFNKLKNI